MFMILPPHRRFFAAIAGAVVAGVALSPRPAFAPVLKANTMRHYRIVPSRADEQNLELLELFAQRFNDFKTTIPNATVEVGREMTVPEGCRQDDNCDIVTIERRNPAYTFMIKNATGKHATSIQCYRCTLGTASDSCDPAARAKFVTFVVKHDICHEDPSKCQDTTCQ